MGFFKSIGSWFGGLVRKRHISVQDNGEERWYTELSPISFVAIGVAVVTFVFGVLLLLVTYTPLLQYMPGYAVNSGNSREVLMQNIVRIDSLERKMNDMLMYNENRILVVNGKTPAIQSVKGDSLYRNTKVVAPSKQDSLLRYKVENDESYRLNNSNSTTENSLNANSPMYGGVISSRFNSKNPLGIRMSGAKDAQVVAIADGVVVLSESSPETGHCIVIQHNDNFLSVYRNLSAKFFAKGERVQESQIIGYARNGDDGGVMLEFELWRDGSAVNPEHYIVF